MVATTRPPESRRSARVVRFDAVERALHWINAALFLTLVLTGAALYVQSIGAIFGRRALVQDIHLYCGLALPAPLLLAVAGRWGGALREDLRRLNRWTQGDVRWMRRVLKWRWPLPRNVVAGVGKFNPGQKLNAAFVAGAGLVLLGTGVIMRWYHPWPLGWRTGATFVHDWLALAVGVVILGHVGMALRDPDALGSMFTGNIRRVWAEEHAPMWLVELDASGEPHP